MTVSPKDATEDKTYDTIMDAAREPWPNWKDWPNWKNWQDEVLKEEDVNR